MSNSVVTLSSFNLLFFTQVLTVLTSTIKYNEYVTDKGKNISIPCIADGTIVWVRQHDNNSTIVQEGKILAFTNVSATDRGLYVCFASVPPSQVDNDSALADDQDVVINTSRNATSDVSDIKDVKTRKPSAEIYTITTNSTKQPNQLSTASATELATPKIVTSTTSPHPTPTATTTVVLTKALTNTSNRRNYNSNTIVSSGPKESIEEQEFQAFQKVNLSVRTPPGPVTQLYFKASTILGFLIWRFNKTNSGGYPIRSFTAEYRNVSYREQPYNSSFEHEWSRMDPINIAPNVRQMEVYRLEPNTTYEFRIWANNQLGSGEVVTTNVTTLPETREEDLIRLIQPDLDNFDPRIWIVAVSVVLGTLVILAIGLCVVLTKECYQSSQAGVEDGWDSVEIIPNIILNPGFCDSDAHETAYTRTIIFGEEDDSDDSCESESDHEPPMEKFKRKVSIFFTGPTIKRI